ncbi:hypothetical protein CCMA1212_009433 [Trichoderma ghanense]|uniref:Secreted protein n=1 Tax=Trichoderma ghanense TaxID=65468 RepID=A0ABY2GUE7_9HYPO
MFASPASARSSLGLVAASRLLGLCLLLVRGSLLSSLRLRQRIHSLSPSYWVPHLRPRSHTTTELPPAAVQPGLITRLISRTGRLLSCEVLCCCMDSRSLWSLVSDHPGLVQHVRFRKSVAWRPWMPPACWLAVSQLISHRLSIGFPPPWPWAFLVLPRLPVLWDSTRFPPVINCFFHLSRPISRRCLNHIVGFTTCWLALPSNWPHVIDEPALNLHLRSTSPGNWVGPPHTQRFSIH